MYDPLGVIAPVVLPMKLLFQQLCPDKLGWDDELDDQLKLKVQSWLVDLVAVQRIKIPRCYFSGAIGKITSVQLHGFGDASSSAYAAVVCLRVIIDQESHIKLTTSKTRAAPIARPSIPRLELLSATILSRPIKTTEDALQLVVKIDEIYCWVDSMTVVYWILEEDKEWKPFVQNRVSEIRKLVPPASWLHCLSQQNMADVASRGTLASRLVRNERWWNGPHWLNLPQNEWASHKIPIVPTLEAQYRIFILS